MKYLKPYEIQHPNLELENIIDTLQYLTSIDELRLTKAGLDELATSILDKL